MSGEITDRGPSLRVAEDPACPAVVAALEHDPFYRAICESLASNSAWRRAALSQYFAYSIREGREFGRTVHLPNPAHGVAVWHLPQPLDVRERADRRKREFLRGVLGAIGVSNYERIVRFMQAQTESIVDPSSWYLSIIAVDPTTQGRGLGQRLLEPTLAEADRDSAACYLETFSPRNPAFYERIGFRTRARFTEPTTRSDYAVMVRDPVKTRRGGA